MLPPKDKRGQAGEGIEGGRVIHDLKKQGLSIAAIGRKVGCDRKTVRIQSGARWPLKRYWVSRFGLNPMRRPRRYAKDYVRNFLARSSLFDKNRGIATAISRGESGPAVKKVKAVLADLVCGKRLSMGDTWEPEELYLTKDGRVFRERAQLRMSFLEAREVVVDAKQIRLRANFWFERG